MEPRLGISCYRGSEGVAIVMSQCHAILAVHVLTKAGELVLDPMAGKGESGVSHSTPVTNPAYSSISMVLMAMRASTVDIYMFVSICATVKKNIKKKSQVPFGGFTRRRPGGLAPGVVLLEAAAFWPWCKFLGLELDQQQLALRLRKDLDMAGLDGFANPIGRKSLSIYNICIGMLWHVNMHFCTKKKHQIMKFSLEKLPSHRDLYTRPEGKVL